MKLNIDLDVMIRPIELWIKSNLPSINILEEIHIQGAQIMATVQDVLDGQAAILQTVTTEAAEVKTAIDAQAALIAELQAIIANGNPVTAEQLQAMADGNAAIQAAVSGIFTSPVVV